jgi:hypothetical protein
MNKLFLILNLAWVVLWIPISFLFQINPHFYSNLVAPLMGFIAVVKGNCWHGNCFKEILLPWVVFWLGLIIINLSIFLTQKSIWKS